MDWATLSQTNRSERLLGSRLCDGICTNRGSHAFEAVTSEQQNGSWVYLSRYNLVNCMLFPKPGAYEVECCICHLLGLNVAPHKGRVCIDPKRYNIRLCLVTVRVWTLRWTCPQSVVLHLDMVLDEAWGLPDLW